MFEFIKHIQPGNYYRLIQQMPQAILVLNDEQDNLVGYSNAASEKLDIAYRNLQQGLIPNPTTARLEYQYEIISDVFDNYIFLRRYFSKFQVYWVLIFRLFSLYNPIIEFGGFIKSQKHKRISLKPREYVGYDNFLSVLVNENPLVSIIIPTLNRYEYLKDVLYDLEQQSYKNFEVIICDQSEPVDEKFYKNWNLNIKLIQQEEKALWLARNKCIQQSNGEFILLFDDDSRVEANWIESHLKCLDYFNVKISAGVTNTLVGGGLGKKDNYFHLSDVFDTGNAMVHRTVFHSVGLFDRQFEKQRMGDGEFGLRATLGGFLVVSNPFAKRIHLKVETGGLRQMGSWDAFRPKNLFSPRPVPSVLYLIRKYFGAEESILFLLKNIPQSYIPYSKKGSKTAKILIYLLLPFWFPFALISVSRSWRESNRKLKQGAIISILEK